MFHTTKRDLLKTAAAAMTAGTMAFVTPAFAQDASTPPPTESQPAAQPTDGEASTLNLTPPAEREGEYLEREGARIFYQVSGEGDPIVLLHGYPLSGALFSQVREELNDTHQVITIDHRGYGNSTTPEVVQSVSTYAEDAIAVLNELGIDNAIIGGMSMGGPIVFEMYRQAPSLFRGMILIDTTAGKAKPMEAGIWEGAEIVLKGGKVADIIPFLMNKMLTGDTRMQMPELVTYVENMIKQASVDGAVGGARVLAGRPDSTDLLPKIDIPVLVLVGKNDPVYPYEISQMMVDALPNATLAVIDAANHAAILERPQESAQAIEDWTNSMQ